MTNTIVIGNKETFEKKSPIYFIGKLDKEGGSLFQPSLTINHPNIISSELIFQNYISGPMRTERQKFDLMFAYNDEKKRSGGNVFIGKWNDGFVA